MREHYRTLLNWRTHVLAILAAPALFLLLCISEDIITLLISKVAGAAIAYTACRLEKYWAEKGKINELMKLINEED